MTSMEVGRSSFTEQTVNHLVKTDENPQGSNENPPSNDVAAHSPPLDDG